MFLLASALVSLIDAAERGLLVLLLIIDDMRTFEGNKKEMSRKNIFWSPNKTKTKSATRENNQSPFKTSTFSIERK